MLKLWLFFGLVTFATWAFLYMQHGGSGKYKPYFYLLVFIVLMVQGPIIGIWQFCVSRETSVKAGLWLEEHCKIFLKD